MAKKVKARLYRRNNDEIVVCIRKYPWPIVALFFIPPVTPLIILAWLFGYRGGWTDVAVYNSLLYSIDDELNLLSIEAEELYAERVAEESQIKAHIDFIKSSEKARVYYSEEFDLDISQLKNMSMRAAPETLWKKVFKFGDKKATTTRQKLGLEDHPRANRAVFTDNKLEGMGYLIEDLARINYNADDVLPNIGKPSGNNNSNNGPMDNNTRKKRKDLNETDASHQRRLEAMKSGNFNHDSWDYSQ